MKLLTAAASRDNQRIELEKKRMEQKANGIRFEHTILLRRVALEKSPFDSYGKRGEEQAQKRRIQTDIQPLRFNFVLKMTNK